MALIVIEGCDGAGKSTLIEQLRRNATRYFVIVRSAGSPRNPDVASRFLAGISQLAMRMDPQPVICDRFVPISDPIYGVIVRGEDPTPFKWSQLRDVDKIVYCRPPREVIFDQIRKQEQMAGVLERADAIITAYDRFFNQARALGGTPSIFQYDYTLSSVDSVESWLGFSGVSR